MLDVGVWSADERIGFVVGQGSEGERDAVVKGGRGTAAKSSQSKIGIDVSIATHLEYTPSIDTDPYV